MAMLPSEQIHIGSQVGRVYRLVLREDSQVFALLMVLLEYVTQPKKKSRQGSQESREELAVRQSSPKSWTVAFIPTPETFAPSPTRSEVVVNTPIILLPQNRGSGLYLGFGFWFPSTELQ